MTRVIRGVNRAIYTGHVCPKCGGRLYERPESYLARRIWVWCMKLGPDLENLDAECDWIGEVSEL